MKHGPIHTYSKLKLEKSMEEVISLCLPIRLSVE